MGKSESRLAHVKHERKEPQTLMVKDAVGSMHGLG